MNFYIRRGTSKCGVETELFFKKKKKNLFPFLQLIIFLCPLHVICSKTPNLELIHSIILANLDVTSKASGKVLSLGFAYNLFFPPKMYSIIEMKYLFMQLSVSCVPSQLDKKLHEGRDRDCLVQQLYIRAYHRVDPILGAYNRLNYVTHKHTPKLIC